MYLSGNGRASQEIALSGSCPQAFVDITLVSGFGDCIWDESPDGAVSGWPFLQSLLHTLSLYLLPWVIVSKSKKRQSVHTLVFVLEFHAFCNLYLEYSKFLG